MDTFTEITFTDGDCEVMAHKTARGWNHFYVFTSDLHWFPKRWRFEPSINPLFHNLTYPSPAKAVTWCEREGMIACE